MQKQLLLNSMPCQTLTFKKRRKKKKKKKQFTQCICFGLHENFLLPLTKLDKEFLIPSKLCIGQLTKNVIFCVFVLQIQWFMLNSYFLNFIAMSNLLPTSYILSFEKLHCRASYCKRFHFRHTILLGLLNQISAT